MKKTSIEVNAADYRRGVIFGLTMAEYLLPEANLSIEEQREVFSIRCRSNPLPANRGITEYCTTQCGEILNNSHIFKCNNLNEPGQEFEIDKKDGIIIKPKTEELGLFDFKNVLQIVNKGYVATKAKIPEIKIFRCVIFSKMICD